MTTSTAPVFPRCVGCNQRLNVWTLRYCMECQIASRDAPRQ